MRRLWTEPTVTFDGAYERVTGAGWRRCRCSARSRSGSARSAEPRCARVGRLADGWFPQVPPGPRLDEARAIVRRAAADAGRDPDAIGMEGRISWGEGGVDELVEARRPVARRRRDARGGQHDGRRSNGSRSQDEPIPDRRRQGREVLDRAPGSAPPGRSQWVRPTPSWQCGPPQCSTTLPSRMRRIAVPLISTGSPEGSTPKNAAPVCVPFTVQFETTRSSVLDEQVDGERHVGERAAHRVHHFSSSPRMSWPTEFGVHPVGDVADEVGRPELEDGLARRPGTSRRCTRPGSPGSRTCRSIMPEPTAWTGKRITSPRDGSARRGVEQSGSSSGS